MFKLTRMTDLNVCEDRFERQSGVFPDMSPERIFPEKIRAKAVFQPECKWRLIEEYGWDSFAEQEDGTLLFDCGFTDTEYLKEWLLNFGDKVELLEPVEVREDLLKVAEKLCEKYAR